MAFKDDSRHVSQLYERTGIEMNEKKIIELKGVSKTFDDEIILDNVDLKVYEKEFMTLLGPSGCGKTTTLRIIAGFVTPDSGDVLFDEVRINDVPPHKRQVNTIFQRYALFPHLNVYDNIAFGLRVKKMKEKDIAKKVNNFHEYGKRITRFEAYAEEGKAKPYLDPKEGVIINPEKEGYEEDLSTLNKMFNHKRNLKES